MVEHEPQQSRFVIRKDGHECVLAYQLVGNEIDFSSTYVPFALRGQGLAEELVKAGLVWARSQQFNIEASCWYVQKFL